MPEYELKKCPFCGGEAFIDNHTQCFGHGEYITGHNVECANCGASSQVFYEYGWSKEHCINKAVEFWNRRKEVE